jgi:20S proteasome subunit alpha 5
LQDQYNKSMTMAEAQLLALSTLKQVMEEKISSSNVEIAVVTAAEKQFRLLSVAELDAIVAQLP